MKKPRQAVVVTLSGERDIKEVARDLRSGRAGWSRVARGHRCRHRALLIPTS